MKIKCSSCGRDVPASDVDIRSQLAKCTSCDNVFNISSQVPGGGSINRDTVPPPKCFEINYVENGIEIVRRWFGPVAYFFAFFSAFWNGITFTIIFQAIKAGEWGAVAFCSIHGSIGLGMLYFTIACFINRTYIRVAYQSIDIKHKPLPWPGSKRVNSSDLKQLFSKEKIHRNRNGVSYSYEVHAITHAGATIKMVTGMQKSEHAIFIEQQIENYLGIRDESVRGEMSRQKKD